MEDKNKDILLLGAIRDAEANAYGGDGDSDLSTSRARAIDDYLGKPYGNEVTGRSQVVSRDVYDTIEWIKPSLLRIFTSGDEVAQFEPTGPEDEQMCRQETDYVNYILKEKNPWFNICYEWFTDALLTKNAYVLAYYDTTQTVESETYKGLTDEQFTLLVNDDVEVLEHSMSPAPMPAEVAAQFMANGMPIPNVHDVKVKRTKEIRGVKLCVLPPERCMVSENVTGMSVRNADFFGYWEIKSISELRKMGFDVDDDISDEMRSLDNEEDQARDQFSEDTLRTVDGSNDPSTRKVTLSCCWIKYDYDEDGIAEYRYIMRVGETILYNDEASGVPVAAIVPTPLPHRHPGLSVRDMVSDLQEIKTAIWRGGLDNLYLSNNGRYGISDKVNISDMLNSRPGGLVRVAGGSPGNEIFPLVHPVTIAPALQMMEYTDSIRQSRTGASSQAAGIDPNVISKSHSGVAINQLTSNAAVRIEMIARVFAEGVKELCLIVHELSIKHGHQAEVVKLRNQWITVNPSEWKNRMDMKLTVGLGTGNKEQLMSNLMLIFAAQKEMLGLGITNPKLIYNTLSELTKAAGFPSEQKFWAEPQGPLPQQPNPDVVKVQAQMQIEQAKLQAKEKELVIQSQLDERKAAAQLQQEQLRSQNDVAIEQARVQAEMELEKWKAELEAQTALQKTQLELQAKREIEAMKASAPQKDAVTINNDPKGDFSAALQQMMEKQSEQINLLVQAMMRPKQIVRGPDGRAVGVQ